MARSCRCSLSAYHIEERLEEDNAGICKLFDSKHYKHETASNEFSARAFWCHKLTNTLQNTFRTDSNAHTQRHPELQFVLKIVKYHVIV